MLISAPVLKSITGLPYVYTILKLACGSRRI